MTQVKGPTFRSPPQSKREFDGHRLELWEWLYPSYLDEEPKDDESHPVIAYPLVQANGRLRMSGRSSKVRMLAVTISSFATFGAGPLRYKGKPFLTYPMPPKETPEDPLRIFPAMQVPEDPQRYIWTLIAPKFSAGIKEVPVYLFDERLKPVKVGSLPLGTTIKLEKFMSHGKSHFYSVPWKNSIAWVNGVFIAPKGFAAPGK